MDQKKIITIISLILFIGGVIALAVWIKHKPTEEQEAFERKFTQDMHEAKTGSIRGVVETITAEKLIIFSDEKKRTELNINEATPVVFMNKAKKLTNGKITDVKARDIIDLEYDRVTKDVVLIIEFKP